MLVFPNGLMKIYWNGELILIFRGDLFPGFLDFQIQSVLETAAVWKTGFRQYPNLPADRALEGFIPAMPWAEGTPGAGTGKRGSRIPTALSESGCQAAASYS